MASAHRSQLFLLFFICAASILGMKQFFVTQSYNDAVLRVEGKMEAMKSMIADGLRETNEVNAKIRASLEQNSKEIHDTYLRLSTLSDNENILLKRIDAVASKSVGDAMQLRNRNYEAEAQAAKAEADEILVAEKRNAAALTSTATHQGVPTPGAKCKVKKVGGDPKNRNYGGWVICPDALSSNPVILSFGIGHDITFDKAVINQYNAIVHGFDPTLEDDVIKAKFGSWPAGFEFHKIGLGATDTVATFIKPPKKEYASYKKLSGLKQQPKPDEIVSFPIKSLKSIMTMLNLQYVDHIKMDIEGYEFDLVNDPYFTSSLPTNMISIEIHDRFYQNGLQKRKQLIDAIKKQGFSVVSDGEEVTLVRNK